MKRLRPHQIASIIFCVCICFLPLHTSAQEEWYSVQSGDTLESIAAHFGESAQSIIERNGLARASKIVAGQILIIPMAEQAPPEQDSSVDVGVEDVVRTHKVRRGESLQEIGKRYGIEWQTLAALNQISNPNLIYAGQMLTVPAAGQAESAPISIATRQPASPVQRQVQPSLSRRQHRIYIVQNGDSVNRVAQRFGVAEDEILRLNGLAAGTRLFIGDLVLIPASSTAPSMTTDADPAAGGFSMLCSRVIRSRPSPRVMGALWRISLSPTIC